MRWEEGRAVIEALLDAGRLQQVTGDLSDADSLLQAAATHLTSAEAIAQDDPDGAYSLLYTAARKSLAAVLLAQGLRPTSSGGHVAVQEAIEAQFVSPPPSVAFKAFGRMRSTRHLGEYGQVGAIDVDLVTADLATVRRLREVAAQLVSALPVFTR